MPSTRRTLIVGSLVAVAMGLASPASAEATPRQDSYFEIWCQTADGGEYLAKRVDARAIQPERDPGGKDTATAQFNANNPFGETCGEVGPFSP
jgi:hypothetical protein